MDHQQSQRRRHCHRHRHHPQTRLHTYAADGARTRLVLVQQLEHDVRLYNIRDVAKLEDEGRSVVLIHMGSRPYGWYWPAAYIRVRQQREVDVDEAMQLSDHWRREISAERRKPSTDVTAAAAVLVQMANNGNSNADAAP